MFETAVRDPSVCARLTEMVDGNDLGLWVRDIASAEQEVPPTELAAAVRAPTLVVAGALDLAGFLDVAGWLAANVAGSVARAAVIVDGVGHMLPMEAPLAFNALLDGFLAQHPASAAPIQP